MWCTNYKIFPFPFLLRRRIDLPSIVPVPVPVPCRVRRGTPSGCTCPRNVLERRGATHGGCHPLYGCRHPLHRRAGALHRVDTTVCEVRAGAHTTRPIRAHRDRLTAHPALRVPIRRLWWGGKRLWDGPAIWVIVR